MTDTTVEAAAGRVRRFLDERARPTPFAPDGFLPTDFLGEITRTGDRLLVSDLRTVLDALPSSLSMGPECADHTERQHRDRRPPWCDECGWRHQTPMQPASKFEVRALAC